MAEPIEMPFGMWTRVGPVNHVLDGGPGPPCEGERASYLQLSLRKSLVLVEESLLQVGFCTHC